MNNISEIISSLGFPIACCCAMFWYMIKSDDRHKNEVHELSKVINQNSNTLIELKTLFESVVNIIDKRD